MAGLPLDRPIPGAPLLDPFGVPVPPEQAMPIAPAVPAGPPPLGLPETDPLAGLPPPPEPQGYQFDATGEPMPWPPADWFATPEGVPTEYQGQDVPVIENAPPPPATTQAGPEGLAALEQARQEGGPPAAPQAPVATPQRDPYLENLDQSASLRAEAELQRAEAEKQKNDYLAAEGARAAQERLDRQTAADDAFAKVTKEAAVRRNQLDQEAQAIAATKTDTGRYWHSMNFGAQLGVIVGAALSGASTHAVMTGQNPVVEQVNKMVAQDLQAQAQDMENRKTGLSMRRGILADDLNAGRDLLDVQYKSLNAAYDASIDQMKAYALRFDNELVNARTAVNVQAIIDAKMESQRAYEAARQKALLDEEQKRYDRKQDAIRNAQTWTQIAEARRARADAAQERNVRAEREDREAAKERNERSIISHKETGKVIGQANSKEAAEDARKIIQNNGRLTALYERGKELFKDGRADNPASDLYRQQKAFDTQWVNATKTADGDFSAPNATDFESRGVFGGLTSMNPLAALEEGYRNGRAQGAAALRPYLDDDTLIAEGFVSPPQKDDAEGNRNPVVTAKTPLVYRDATGELNREGRGTPLDPETSKGLIERWEREDREIIENTYRMKKGTR